MAQSIIKKKYYKIVFELAAPLAIGSGDNESTDKDLIRDANGCPYIPASSITGVIRDILTKKYKDKVKEYFGDVEINRGKNEDVSMSESRIVFYDATISAGTPRITVRDSVALDDYKTAKKGAKFDMEVLEPGVKFTTFIEQNYTSEACEDYGLEIARVFLYEKPLFGGKSMRGYGAICNAAVTERTFDLSKDAEEWLKFDLYDAGAKWSSCEISDNQGESLKEITIHLKLKGGLSIRRYTTKVSKGENSEPDMEQLTVGKEQIPVVPGTSWAGAISQRMKEFNIKKAERGSIFGFVEGDGKDSKARSKISFSESQISGGDFKIISRNSIDRFTGGTVDGALYTEKTYYGGETDLKIGWHSNKSMPNLEKKALAANESMSDLEKKALAAALTDLHYGFLSVGGETSIGRGIFTITAIDGKAVPEPKPEKSGEVYHVILNAIEEVFK